MAFRIAALGAAISLWAAACAGTLLAQTFRNSLGMEFVYVEAGNFMMGSGSDAAVPADDDERPLHRVAISKPFLISLLEVTQAQYERVMGSNPSRFVGAALPVEQLSWLDAAEFLKKLDAAEGGRGLYRLPTEAEWEFAARESHDRFFPGELSEDLLGCGWTGQNSGGATRPAGTMKPTGRGLFDVHGNVSEWTADWYSRSYYSTSPFIDPAGPPSGTARSVRGCSWFDPVRRCRPAYRGFMGPRDRNSYTGFRVVRNPGLYGEMRGK
ncbi:MAG: formylglycine-generating enzyme family protein [Deltaproteobacteria bacterium]|jgi:formylglycine-generating enzyme required for sulfatase activity|nr:formylglycine-generating enzyme family protein [Deltaproteobacteria bacterium]